MILFLCYVFPPMAVLFMGKPFSAILNVFIWLTGWSKGTRHALVCYGDKKSTKMTKNVTEAINHPTWVKEAQRRVVESPVRALELPQAAPRKRVKAIDNVVLVDDPCVGQRGTKFRRKGA